MKNPPASNGTKLIFVAYLEKLRLTHDNTFEIFNLKKKASSKTSFCKQDFFENLTFMGELDKSDDCVHQFRFDR